jgi:hypothetical protein
VVGVAKQLVEILETSSSGSSSLNSDALITLPAFFISSDAVAGVYADLNSDILAFQVNNGVEIQVTFADAAAAGLTPATVVSQINDRLTTLGVTSVLAETVGDDSWQLRTVGLGEFQSIYITSNTTDDVTAAFGIGKGKTYTGIGNFNNYQVDIPAESFPDPNGNLDEISIEYDTVRVFLATGGGTNLVEMLRDESFLSNGEVNVSAVLTGNVDIDETAAAALYGGGGTLDGLTLIISVDGGANQTVTFAAPTDDDDVAQQVNDQTTGVTAAATAVATPSYLELTSDTGGNSSSIDITGGTAQATLGFSDPNDSAVGTSITAVDDGNGDVLTPLIDFNGFNFDDTPGVASLTSSAAVTLPLTAGETLILSDGQQEQTIVFTAAAAIGDVVDEINAVMGQAAGGKILASTGGTDLVLTHLDTGDESYIKIVGGTALGDLDPGGTPVLVAGAEARGVPFKPLPGDELYIDGVFYANIVEVKPGGITDRLKVDRQVTISSDVGRQWYIIAKDLPVGGSVTRPYPDLAVNATTGEVNLKHSFLRDTGGDPSAVVAPIYLSYTAVRQDVSALAAQPGLLTYNSTTELEESLSPVNTDNPLALGLYFALLNATGAQVTGLGVDAVSADMPFGTVAAFTRAAEYLEGFEVYAIAPLTHDNTVAQVFNTHVTFMSEPEQKGERIVLFNPETPTRATDTLVGSDTDGDRISDTVFDTKIANLAALVLNAGVSPVGTVAVDQGLYLDIASDDNIYSIKSISGSQVTVRTVAGDFASGENDDEFYAEETLPTPLISESFAIRVRGDALTTPTGALDKGAVAQTLQDMGATYLERRFWMTFPDQCGASIDGLEQLIDGFYMNAAIVGMIAQQPPQQSFTNFPMTGFTQVVGSQDTYSESQLNTMAAGGVYIIVQDSQGAPLIARMALTTDMTSIETRTDSITKVVDFTAKFMRKGLKNFIGRFNITQSFLDSLGSVIQGLIGFLVESGVLIGGTLNNLIQDEDAPDTVLIDVTLDVPFPCNYIRLTLVV